MELYMVLGALLVPVLLLASFIAFRGGRMDNFDDRGRGANLPHGPRRHHNVTNGTGWGGTLGAGTWGGGDMGGDWGGRDLGQSVDGLAARKRNGHA